MRTDEFAVYEKNLKHSRVLVTFGLALISSMIPVLANAQPQPPSGITSLSSGPPQPIIDGRDLPERPESGPCKYSDCNAMTSLASLPRSGDGVVELPDTNSTSALLTEVIPVPMPLGSRARAQPRATLNSTGLRLVDAIRTTLELHPLIDIQELAVVDADGRLQEAGGQFDTTVSATTIRHRQEIPISVTDDLASLTNHTSYSVEVSKQFRNGLTITPGISLTRTAETTLPPSVASLLEEMPNQSNLSVSLTQPLLRGRGREIVGAIERMNEIEREASDQDLAQMRSNRALISVIAYWQYLAALRTLEILQSSEARSRDLVGRTQELIDGGNRPASDLTQARANLAGHMSQRLAAEQRLFEAGHFLGLSLGLTTNDVNLPPLPADNFPPITEDEAPPSTTLVQQALQQRSDIAAARDRLRQERVGLTAALDALQPRLDLSASAGYSGLDVGGSFDKFLTPFWASVSGPNASVGLTLELPVGNASAKGQLVQSRSALSQRTVGLADLERTIRSNVLVARDNLIRSAERVRSSQAAAGLYRTAIVDEQLRQELGLSTVIDLIVTEERLTDSLLEEISARLSYASAIATLRYETGSLLRPGPATEAVDLQRLTTVPRPRLERQ